jgi:hypothetical protein
MRVASAGQLHLFRRGPPERVPPALEFATACALADTLKRSARADWQWSAFPAGELRSQATGERLRRMGLAKGWPDYLFVSPAGQLHFLELKRGTRGRLTDEQAAFRDWCVAHAVPWQLARSYDEAIAAVAAWGALKHKVEPQ